MSTIGSLQVDGWIVQYHLPGQFSYHRTVMLAGKEVVNLINNGYSTSDAIYETNVGLIADGETLRIDYVRRE